MCDKKLNGSHAFSLALSLRLCIIFLCLVRCDVPKEDKGCVDLPNKQRPLNRETGEGRERLGLRPLWKSYAPTPQLHAAPPGKKKKRDRERWITLPAAATLNSPVQISCLLWRIITYSSERWEGGGWATVRSGAAMIGERTAWPVNGGPCQRRCRKQLTQGYPLTRSLPPFRPPRRPSPPRPPKRPGDTPGMQITDAAGQPRHPGHILH